MPVVVLFALMIFKLMKCFERVLLMRENHLVDTCWLSEYTKFKLSFAGVVCTRVCVCARFLCIGFNCMCVCLVVMSVLVVSSDRDCDMHVYAYTRSG